VPRVLGKFIILGFVVDSGGVCFFLFIIILIVWGVGRERERERGLGFLPNPLRRRIEPLASF
jgi:hypothetical protein